MRLSFLSERFSNDFNSATTQMNLDSLSRDDVMFSEKRQFTASNAQSTRAKRETEFLKPRPLTASKRRMIHFCLLSYKYQVPSCSGTFAKFENLGVYTPKDPGLLECKT